jgi:hypothetical protein
VTPPQPTLAAVTTRDRAVSTPPSSRTSRSERARSRRTLASLAVMAGGALVAFGATFLSSSGPRLHLEPRVDEEGRDHLMLRCPSCGDGTTVTIDGASGTFRAGAAEVTLAAPLRVGDNAMEAHLHASGDDSDETVRFRLQIPFRVRSDTAEVTTDVPRIAVRVEAPTTAKVRIDGAPIALDTQGQGSKVLDLSDEARGPTLETRTVERRVPYSLELADGTTQAGGIAVRASITPLMVDGPAPGTVVDGSSVIVRGRTLRTASLRVGAEMNAVRADGSFAFSVPVPPGTAPTLVLRAYAPGMAPRLVEVPLRRGEVAAAHPAPR